MLFRSKTYTSPKLEIVSFNLHDVILASVVTGDENKVEDGTIVAQIPLNDGTMYDVTQKKIEFYHGLYPAVDILQEIRNIVGWNNSNPSRRKTRGGIERHINTWLADKQNKPQRRPYGSQQQQQQYVPIPPALPTEDDYSNPF